MTEQERFEVYIAKRTLMPANLAKISANSTDYADRTVQMHWLTWQAAQQKEGYVFVKSQLDSDAKAKMIGEYNVPVSSICPDCTGEGCCECNNTGTISQNVTVSWTTVKQIYRDGIFFMAQAAQEPT